MNFENTMTSERSQTHKKSICDMTSFTKNVQNRQTDGVWKQINDYQGQNVGTREMSATGLLFGVIKCSERSGINAKNCEYSKNCWIICFKRVNFMACKWCPNKTVTYNIMYTIYITYIIIKMLAHTSHT